MGICDWNCLVGTRTNESPLVEACGQYPLVGCSRVALGLFLLSYSLIRPLEGCRSIVGSCNGSMLLLLPVGNSQYRSSSCRAFGVVIPVGACYLDVVVASCWITALSSHWKAVGRTGRSPTTTVDVTRERPALDRSVLDEFTAD